MVNTLHSYVEEVIKRIYYNPVRIKIKKELLDHMIDKRKDLNEIYSWSEATEIVITEMGDVKELSKSFNRLYSPFKHYLSLLLTLVLIVMVTYVIGYVGNQGLKAIPVEPRTYNAVEVIPLNETYYVDDSRIRFTYVVLTEDDTFIYYKIDDDRLVNVSQYSIFDVMVYSFLDVVDVESNGVFYGQNNGYFGEEGFGARLDDANLFYSQYYIKITDVLEEVTIYFNEYDRNLEVPLSWTIEN